MREAPVRPRGETFIKRGSQGWACSSKMGPMGQHVPPSQAQLSAVPTPIIPGTAASGPWLQRHHRTTGRKHPNTNPQIPNPVICLAAGDVILFQLHLLAHSKCHLGSWDPLSLQVLALHPTMPTPVISQRAYISAAGKPQPSAGHSSQPTCSLHFLTFKA